MARNGRFSKALEAQLSFARWVIRERVDPMDLAELVQLTRKAVAAGERECNGQGDAFRPRRRVEHKAKEMGFETDWPGLFPVLRRRGYDVHLPEVF